MEITPIIEVLGNKFNVSLDWTNISIDEFTFSGRKQSSNLIRKSGTMNGISYTLSIRISTVSKKTEAFIHQSSAYRISKQGSLIHVKVMNLKIKSLNQLGYKQKVSRFGVEFTLSLIREGTFLPDASFYTSFRGTSKKQLETKPVYVKVYNGGSCSSK